MRGALGHTADYSHSRHPLVSESHKGYTQPLHGDPLLLRIKLICALLLQFAVVLFCIHLQKIILQTSESFLSRLAMPWLILLHCSAIQWQNSSYAMETVQLMFIQPTFSKPHMSQQNIWAQGWVVIMTFPSFWAFVAKYSLPFIAFRLQDTQNMLLHFQETPSESRKFDCTSLSPASSVCEHQSRSGCRWLCSWGRPRWWVKV